MLSAASMVLVLAMHAGAGAEEAQAVRLAVAHSHNDYERSRPLEDALAARFPSVEADVWWRDGEVLVSHLPFLFRGRLEDLYLRPLQARVDRLGSVHGDGRPFYLWIELKESRPELTEALHALLERYPMLTVFTDAAVAHRPVTVVLTGDEAAKRRYTDGHRVRLACRDSNRLDPSDAAADRRWTWYALAWGDVVGQSGRRQGLSAALRALRTLVARAHALGRRVRLYEVPERREAWSVALAAGVDLLGTDRVDDLRAFLLRTPVEADAASAP
jgi:glycerophosphoryl diester phosphodiesterase